LLLFLVFPYAILDNAAIDDATITEVRLYYLVSFGISVMGAAAFCNEACVLSALLCHGSNMNVMLFLLFRKLGYDYGYYYAWVGVVLNAFFAYSHVMLLKELRNGRMTAHKDVHENQSCHWVNDNDAV